MCEESAHALGTNGICPSMEHATLIQTLLIHSNNLGSARAHTLVSASRHTLLQTHTHTCVHMRALPAVLDDNCTLCLPNAERIKLNPVTMRMLFEVADLAVASPATVSRCGMVYVPADCVGWRPYVKCVCARADWR